MLIMPDLLTSSKKIGEKGEVIGYREFSIAISGSFKAIRLPI